MKTYRSPHGNALIDGLNWPRLSLSWEGGASAVASGVPRNLLSPTWQVLLLGDGSTTRHLQLLTGEEISVDVLDMSLIGLETDGAPEPIEEVPGPRLRRQVWLKDGSGHYLAYAASWWEASHVDEYLSNRKLPIWSSLADLRMELYRDVRNVFLGDAAQLESAFGYSGPFWGRYYLFWHNGKPLTLIYEVFSPYLERYLGFSKP
ncbi:MAG: chorismate lyase [Thermosynechococcaceae cyanobacterium MS004]|nr:chorismate lyase [Thermosynechococcaceae cyanobacterium MS004]